jgi:hypothetical protein
MLCYVMSFYSLYPKLVTHIYLKAVANRERNLQDVEIRLEDVRHRERSPFIKQLFY